MNPFVANMLLPEWNAGSMTSSNIFVSTIFRFLNVSLFSFWTFHFFFCLLFRLCYFWYSFFWYPSTSPFFNREEVEVLFRSYVASVAVQEELNVSYLT